MTDLTLGRQLPSKSLRFREGEFEKGILPTSIAESEQSPSLGPRLLSAVTTFSMNWNPMMHFIDQSQRAVLSIVSGLIMRRAVVSAKDSAPHIGLDT